MKRPRFRMLRRRWVLSGSVVVGLVLLIAIMPGEIEGSYRNLGVACLCNSLHFTQMRDGKMIMYASSHPPALMIARYVKATDGSVDIFMSPTKEDEPEVLIARAFPRKFVTKFVFHPSGETEWAVKSPITSKMKTIIDSQAIESTIILREGGVEATYYDKALSPIRTEMKTRKN